MASVKECEHAVLEEGQSERESRGRKEDKVEKETKVFCNICKSIIIITR